MNVVITGASRGIGLELTREALSKEFQVHAIARQVKNSPGLKELQKKFPETLNVAAVDLCAPDASAQVEESLSAWSCVDMLINNAGVYCKGDSDEDFLNSFKLNSIVPFRLTCSLLPKLRRSSQPRAIQITSLMGSIADNSSGGSYAYRSSKAALNMINKSLSVDNDWLVSVVVHPGWVKTDMGGSGAPTEARESAAGIWKVISGLKPSDSGRFFDFRGKALPW